MGEQSCAPRAGGRTVRCGLAAAATLSLRFADWGLDMNAWKEQGTRVWNTHASNTLFNPFNPVLTIDLSIPKEDHTLVKVFNLQGRLVTTLFDGVLAPGRHALRFDGAAYSSGMYFVHASSNDGAASIRKVMLLK